MAVTRVVETPRVTLPYREHQWREIEALGRTIDEKLNRAGRPPHHGRRADLCFHHEPRRPRVELHRAEPEKQAKGEKLFKRLQTKLLHRRAHALRPGQVVPGRAIAALGLRLLLAQGRASRSGPTTNLFAETGKNYKVTRPTTPATSCASWPTELSVDPKYVRNAYEDVYQYMFEEARLPYNVSKELDAKMKNPRKSASGSPRSSRTAGLDSVIGHALPVLRANWQTRSAVELDPWQLRTERLMLIPGDSPMGYRLPLESLPWAKASDAVQIVEQDPSERRAALPPAPQRLKKHLVEGRLVSSSEYTPVPVGHARCQRCPHFRLRRAAQRHPARLHAADADGGGLPRSHRGRGRDRRATSACPSSHRGLRAAERQHASAISRSRRTPASSRSISSPPITGPRWSTSPRLALRGSAPLRTHRGEIPARWPPCRHRRRQPHLVLGGATVEDSPLLRRPDLLQEPRRLLAESPRAFVPLLRHVPRADQPDAPHRRSAQRRALRAGTRLSAKCPTRPTVPPWLVDRIFRNILTDVTGNTHRAEFCIDKLFDPEQRDRPPRPARVAQLRNAAARAHEPDAATPDARRRRQVLGATLQGQSRPVGSRSCTIASSSRISARRI